MEDDECSIARRAYYDARRRIEYSGSLLGKMEHVIGQHAIVMIDLFLVREGRGKSPNDHDRLIEKKKRITDKWSDALLDNYRINAYTTRKGESSSLSWSQQDIDYRFRELVKNMVERFDDIATSIILEDELYGGRYSNVKKILTEPSAVAGERPQPSAIEIYSYLSQSAASNFAVTKSRFVDYLLAIQKLANIHETEDTPEEFFNKASACLWTASALGFFLDSVLL